MLQAMHLPDVQKSTQHSATLSTPAAPDMAIAYGMESTPMPIMMLKMETVVWKREAPSGTRSIGSAETLWLRLGSVAAGRRGSSPSLRSLQAVWSCLRACLHLHGLYRAILPVRVAHTGMYGVQAHAVC